MIRRMVEYGDESSCAVVKSKRERRVMLKLRGGTAAFQMETGRWQGVKRENSVCKECNSGEVEDVIHWIPRCLEQPSTATAGICPAQHRRERTDSSSIGPCM